MSKIQSAKMYMWFSFEFIDHDTDEEDPPIISKRFKVLSADPNLWKQWFSPDNQTSLVENKSFEAEGQWGVHDVGFHVGSELLGFSSYEVDPTQYDAVMEFWRKTFHDFGFATHPTETIQGEFAEETDEYRISYFTKLIDKVQT